MLPWKHIAVITAYLIWNPAFSHLHAANNEDWIEINLKNARQIRIWYF